MLNARALMITALLTASAPMAALGQVSIDTGASGDADVGAEIGASNVEANAGIGVDAAAGMNASGDAAAETVGDAEATATATGEAAADAAADARANVANLAATVGSSVETQAGSAIGTVVGLMSRDDEGHLVVQLNAQASANAGATVTLPQSAVVQITGEAVVVSQAAVNAAM